MSKPRDNKKNAFLMLSRQALGVGLWRKPGHPAKAGLCSWSTTQSSTGSSQEFHANTRRSCSSQPPHQATSALVAGKKHLPRGLQFFTTRNLYFGDKIIVAGYLIYKCIYCIILVVGIDERGGIGDRELGGGGGSTDVICFFSGGRFSCRLFSSRAVSCCGPAEQFAKPNGVHAVNLLLMFCRQLLCVCGYINSSVCGKCALVVRTSKVEPSGTKCVPCKLTSI